MILGFGKTQVSNINSLVKSIKNLNIQQAITKLRAKGVADAEIEATLATKGYSEETIIEAMAHHEAGEAEQAHGVKTKALTALQKAGTITSKAFGIALSMGLSIIATKVITGISDLIDRLHETKEEILEAYEQSRTAIDDIKNNMNDSRKTIDECANSFAKLSQGVNQFTGENKILTTDEYEEFLNVSNKLADTLTFLPRKYKENGQAILDLKGNISDINKEIKQFMNSQMLLYHEDISKQMPALLKGYKTNIKDMKSELEDIQHHYDFLQSDVWFNPNDKSNTSNAISGYRNALSKFGIGNDFDLSKYQTYKNGLSTFELPDDILNKIEKEFNNQKNVLKSKLSKENSILNSYIETWLTSDLQFDSIDKDIKELIRNLLNNLSVDELPEDVIKNEDTIYDYLTKTFLDPFNSISEEVKEKISTMLNKPEDMSNIDYISLIEDIQKYFDDNHIDIKLDFMIEDEKDIQKRLQQKAASLTVNVEKQKEFIEYAKDNNIKDNQSLDNFLDITKTANTIEEAINLFDLYLKKNKEVRDVDFFTEDKNKTIDDYKKKVDNLYSTIKKIQDGTATQSDMLNIAEEFKLEPKDIDIASNSYETLLDKLKEKLAKELSGIRKEIDKAFNSGMLTESTHNSLIEFFTNYQDSIYETNASIDSLSSYMSNLKGKYDSVKKAQDEFTASGEISFETLQSLINSYPLLEDQVSKYLEGDIDLSSIIDSFNNAYKQDLNNYKQYYIAKHKYDEDFYKSLKENMSADVKTKLDFYGVDLANYVTLSQLKANLNVIIQTKVSTVGAGALLGDDYSTSVAAKEVEKILNELTKGVEIELPDFSKLFKNGDKDNKDNEIDWVANSIENLNRKLSNLNDELGRTNSFEDRINVYKRLKEANDDMVSATEKGSKAYKDVWNKKSSKISDNYKNLIMSNHKFSVQDFKNDKEYNKIVDAQKTYQQLKSMEQEHQKAIDKRNSDEDARISLLKEQKEIQISNNQLDIESASISKNKNKLLNKEKSLKAKLLEYELSLAKTTEDKLKLEKEYNQYLKDNTRQQYENTNDERNNRLSYWDSRIQDYQNDISLYEIRNDIPSSDAYYQMNDIMVNHKIPIYQKQIESAKKLRNLEVYGSENWEYYNSQIQEAQNGINECTKAQIENNRAIASLPVKRLEKENEELEKQLEIQEKQKSKIESTISAASNIVQEDIDRQNELKETIQDSYDTQIKVIDDKIKALTKVNEQQERELSLEKAKYDLDKAQKQKTVKVIRNGKISYEADQDSIRETQKEYDKEKFNIKVGNLNDEKDNLENARDNEIKAIDKKIKTLTEYKQSIDDIADSWQRVYDLQTLIDEFGENAIKKLNSQDFSIIEDISKSYFNIANMVKNTSDIIDQNNDTINSANKFIEEWDGAPKELSNILYIIGNVINKNKSINTAIQEKNKHTETLSLVWNGTVLDVKSALNNMNKYYEITGDEESEILDRRLSKIKEFAINARATLNEINSTISAIESSKIKADNLYINSALSQNNTGGVIGVAINIATNLVSKNTTTSKTTTTTTTTNKKKVGKSHTGMELGYIRKNMPDGYNGGSSQAKDDFSTISLRKLSDDEIPRVLKIGEAVLSEPQQKNILNNIANSFKAGLNVPKIQPAQHSNSIQFNGNIVISDPVGDVDTLAKKIKSDFLPKLNQELYKK